MRHEALELALELRRAGFTDRQIKDRLFAIRYGRKPFEMSEGAWLRRVCHSQTETPTIQEDHHMDITLNIRLTDVERDRVRATIPSVNGGVYAEASDAQTAAAQAVKSYFVLHPPVDVSKVMRDVISSEWHITGQEAPIPAPPRENPVLLGRVAIRTLLQNMIDTNGRVRIEYEDATGHRTTRTIAPSKFEGYRVIAFDDLRQAIRSFTLSGISSAQEV
jgi:hypothetical protein